MATRRRALHKVMRERFETIAQEQPQEFRLGIGQADAPSRLRAAQDIEGCASVLDIGCGPAVTLETLYANPPVAGAWDYLGLDSSPEFLRLAQQVVDRAPAEVNASVKISDAEDLSAIGRTYEAVVLRHLLEHLEDPAPTLAEALRLCSKRLVLVFSQYPVDDDLSILTDTHLRVPRFAHSRAKLEQQITRATFSLVTQDRFQPKQSVEESAVLVPREAYWVAERAP